MLSAYLSPWEKIFLFICKGVLNKTRICVEHP